MSKFKNDAINRVTIHSTIAAFAQGSGGTFLFVFLLKAGVSAPLVLLAIAGMTFGRLLMRPLVLVVARWRGLKASLMLGALVEAAVYPLIPLVHGPGSLLGLVVVINAFGSVFYWTSFHAYFASIGDPGARGRQVAAIQAAMAVMGILAPALAGLALVYAGATLTFWAVGLAQALSILPLFGAPDVRVQPRRPPGFRPAWLAVCVMAADGWFDAFTLYVWQIGLFVTVGEAFQAFGGAMAVAGVGGALATLVVGRLVDLGHARRSVMVTFSLSALAVLARALSLGHAGAAVLANAFGSFSVTVFVPTQMAAVYAMAKASPCPLRFHMATEGGWDLGGGLGCLAAAALTGFGAPLAVQILLALGGVAGAVILLLRYYAAPT